MNDIKNADDIFDLMKAADTDGSGSIDYTGKNILTFRISGCNYGCADFYKRGKFKNSLRNV